jgi:hypothetical protein
VKARRNNVEENGKYNSEDGRIKAQDTGISAEEKEKLGEIHCRWIPSKIPLKHEGRQI